MKKSVHLACICAVLYLLGAVCFLMSCKRNDGKLTERERIAVALEQAGLAGRDAVPWPVLHGGRILLARRTMTTRALRCAGIPRICGSTSTCPTSSVKSAWRTRSASSHKEKRWEEGERSQWRTVKKLGCGSCSGPWWRPGWGSSSASQRRTAKNLPGPRDRWSAGCWSILTKPL